MKEFWRENKTSIIGGIVTFIISGLGIFIIGNVSGYEAKQLIRSSISGINMLCNTIILASATILALLLTLLGISSSTKPKLKEELYMRILQLARFDTILFIGALLLFQFFNLPITESDKVPTSWFELIYWSTLFFSSLMSGMMVTVILLLSNTVRNMVSVIGFGKGHFIITEEDAEESEKKQEDK